jgi:hypothetical protein
MHVITTKLTDESGKERSSRFWVDDADVKDERKRFEDAGYTVTFDEYHWIIGTHRNGTGTMEWVSGRDLEAKMKELHGKDYDLLVFNAPGQKLQRHWLAEPQKGG